MDEFLRRCFQKTLEVQVEELRRTRRCRLAPAANALALDSKPAIAQLVEHLTVECCSNQMVPGSIPGGRILLKSRGREKKKKPGTATVPFQFQRMGAN